MLSSIPFHIGLLKAELTDGKKSTNAHVLVYGAVMVHDMGEKGCIASNNKIAEETGYSKQRVADVLSEMNAAGWLSVFMKDGKRTKIIPHLTIGKSQEGGFLPVRRGVLASKNIDNSIDNNPTGSIAAGDGNAPKEEESKILKLFFLVVKTYGVAPQNRNYYKKWAKDLVDMHGEERAELYLNRLLERNLREEAASADDGEFVPTLNSASDIVFKSQKVIRYYSRTRRTAHGGDE